MRLSSAALTLLALCCFYVLSKENERNDFDIIPCRVQSRLRGKPIEEGEEDNNKKIIVIGDIHGCLHGFLEVMYEADLTLSTQELRSDLEKLARPFGFEKDMALEDKGRVEIRKGIFLHARPGLTWTTGGEISRMSSKQIDRKFNHAFFPCFGACAIFFRYLV